MATVKDITKMCKEGQIDEAYNLAKADLESRPSDPWTQREVGWALYYLIKSDCERGGYEMLIEHLDELKNLDQLTIQDDSLIFDNVLWKIGDFLKGHVFLNDMNVNVKLSTFFAWLRNYDFKPAKGYSHVLQCYLKYEDWGELADFFDWWNLEKLTDDDYTPFVMQDGKKLMTLAERAYIANSKALMKKGNKERIEEFLPKLEDLMNRHPEMMYPGYFYGKMLMALGSDTEEALKVIVPFARKKSSDFWVWQLLGDAYYKEPEKQLACLLRAVHCKTQESFLGQVRIKLANRYIQQNKLGCAKYHIDKVVRCYATEGWRLPRDVDYWIHQPWITNVEADENESLDYMSITNEILFKGSEEAIGVVTYVDANSHKAALIYENKKRLMQNLRAKVNVGDIVKINYFVEADGAVKVLSCTKASLPNDLIYAKWERGTVIKRDDKDFAFLKTSSADCFVAPNLVKKYNVVNGETVDGLLVFDYDKKKNSWNWICVRIKNI